MPNIEATEAETTVKFAIFDAITNTMHLNDAEKMRDAIFESINDVARVKCYG